MDLLKMFEATIEKKASDLHITVGVPPMLRINGRLEPFGDQILMGADINLMIKEFLTDEQYEELKSMGELDMSFSKSGLGRFRVNLYRQRGSYSIALRVLALSVPTMESLMLPPIVKDLALKPRGLVLVTGPTGSGKSTTLASMIDYINKNKSCHILTLEDPIEYLHRHQLSLVNQREIGNDSKSFANALRAALRQDPDVILVGEMRDVETISIALTAAETGHLVLSTLHTVGAVKTMDRIIDVFPTHQQQQVRIQLSSVLEGILSQQLMPRADGNGRIAAIETMVATPAIRNLVREAKTHQIQSLIQTGAKFGMKTMDSALAELCNKGLIDSEEALNRSVDREMLERLI